MFQRQRQPPSPKQPAVQLAFLPFYHAFSLHMAGLRLFFNPVCTVILTKWNAGQMLRAIEK